MARPPVFPDLVCRHFTATAPGTKMVADITYIPTWEGWVYLATVIDCYSKKVIAFTMDDNYQTPLITTAIRRASHNQRLVPGAIFHTDRDTPTPPMISGPCSRLLTSDAQPGVPGSATTTCWPNRSLPP
jgi:transposase InsO family protein